MSNWTYHWVPVNMKRGYLEKKKKTWWFWRIFWKPIGHGRTLKGWKCVWITGIVCWWIVWGYCGKKKVAVYCGDGECGVLRGWAMNVEVNVEVSEWSERWSLSAFEGFNINLAFDEWVAARCKSYRNKELGVFLLMKGMYYYFSRKRNTGVGQQEEGKMESLLNYVYLNVLQFSRYEYWAMYIWMYYYFKMFIKSFSSL